MLSKEQILNMIPDEVSLIYLSKFGSHLYGTDSMESDLDIKGVFLPEKTDLLLGKKQKSISFSTGDKHEKNTSKDIDIQLWSIHYFLELVKKGETNALDLLFSPSNDMCPIYESGAFEYLHENALKLFDPRENTSLVGYCVSQARRYGIRGSRLGAVKKVYEFLKIVTKTIDPDCIKVADISSELMDSCMDDSFCFQKEINGEPAIVLCGKVHLESIKVREFFNRIEGDYTKYGERSRKAEQNEGIDWKAISHAVRAITQMVQLLTEGRVTYPLKNAKILKRIKLGQYAWKEAEELIYDGLARVDDLRKSDRAVKGRHDKEFVEKFILRFYGM